jgi:hypothetical protein
VQGGRRGGEGEGRFRILVDTVGGARAPAVMQGSKVFTTHSDDVMPGCKW